MADPASREGSSYASPAILEFVAGLHAPHDAVLDSAFTAPSRTSLPPIQLGRNEGKLVHLLARLVSAKRILEVGALAGYSGVWLARALAHDGLLVTIDHDPEACRVTREHFAAAGLADRTLVLEGDGVAMLTKAEAYAPFDLVFLDADKGRYDAYGRFARDHLRPGGLLVADNAFLFGRLLEDGPESTAMRRFHAEMAEAFDSVTVPTPDGLALGIRRA